MGTKFGIEVSKNSDPDGVRHGHILTVQLLAFSTYPLVLSYCQHRPVCGLHENVTELNANC
jgi:hypothetical protein